MTVVEGRAGTFVALTTADDEEEDELSARGEGLSWSVTVLLTRVSASEKTISC